MKISNPKLSVKFDCQFFHTLPFHFYWKDKKGRYHGCNDTQAQFAGFNTGSDLLGLNDSDLCWAPFAQLLSKK